MARTKQSQTQRSKGNAPKGARSARTRGRAGQKRSLMPFYLALGLAGILGLMVILIKTLNPSTPVTVAVPPRADLNAPVGQTADGFWYKGDPNAPVKVIEYADYQCPGCFAMEAELVKVGFDQKYVETGKVQYIYHELPLTSIHESAQLTAEVARCAGDQGLFWPVHDALFDTQKQWAGQSNAREFILATAKAAQVDSAKLQDCLDGGAQTATVDQAAQSAQKLGINSTPSVTVNGKPVAFSGTSYTDSLIAMIEANLATKSGAAAP